MVAGAFPLVKLGYLAVKQISKPIANSIKRSAKASPFFGKYVCMPPAQIYHWLETNFRMRLLGLGKAKHVEKLADEMAIQLGAEMLGEFVIFGVAAVTLTIEYARSAAKEALKEETEKQAVLTMMEKLQDLDLATRMQDVKIKELQRSVDVLEIENRLMTRMLEEKRPGQQ